jgi:hypothetical protein
LSHADEFFKLLVKDPSTLTSLLKKFDVYQALAKSTNIKRAVLKELGDSVDEVIQKIPTVTKIDDLGPDAARIIRANPSEFVIAFSKNIKKELIEELISEMIGVKYSVEIIQGIKRLSSNKNIYAELAKSISPDSKAAFDQAIYKYKDYFPNGGLKYQALSSMLTRRFNTQITQNILDGYQIYNKIILNSSDILTPTKVAFLIDNILKGSYKTLDEISNIPEIGQIAAQNIAINSDVFIPILQRMSNASTKNLVNDLVSTQIRRLTSNNPILTASNIKNIVNNGLTKTQILATLGEGVYEELQKNTFNVITNLSNQTVKNTSLIRSLVKDYALNKGLTDEVIESVFKNGSFKFVKITDDEVKNVGRVFQQYFKAYDSRIYEKFTEEWSMIRGKDMYEYFILNKKAIIKNNITYSSLVEKYGIIKYNDLGFPIFDQHAIAYLEIPDLTGINAIDQELANLMHHGNKNYNIYGYSWHHLEDGKGMILVPTELNSAYSHSGGASYIRDILSRS